MGCEISEAAMQGDEFAYKGEAKVILEMTQNTLPCDR